MPSLQKPGSPRFGRLEEAGCAGAVLHPTAQGVGNISALPQRNRTGAGGSKARPRYCGTLKVNQEGVAAVNYPGRQPLNMHQVQGSTQRSHGTKSARGSHASGVVPEGYCRPTTQNTVWDNRPEMESRLRDTQLTMFDWVNLRRAEEYQKMVDGALPPIPSEIETGSRTHAVKRKPVPSLDSFYDEGVREPHLAQSVPPSWFPRRTSPRSTLHVAGDIPRFATRLSR
ncbi:hypothetical protein BJV74DRAFT_554191 [Russula compacta]|nr:hypothetical protein BJV74DRAFT_554191 [Russula compacta]